MADVGRPLKFASVEDLEQKIESYFDSCFDEVWEERTLDNGETEWKRKYSHTGEPMIKQVSPFTLSGLAVHIGCDRKTLLNYSHRDEYFPTIKMAKARIEAYVESELFSGKPAAGAIFNLKNNYDWSDKQDVALSGSMHNTTQDVSGMTPEERRARIDELERRRRIGTDPATGG